MHSLLQRLLAFIGCISPHLDDFTQQASLSRQPANAATADPLSSAIQREIREQRKFSLAEAIGREGGSFMKGESTIPRPLRAIAEINQFITTHLRDPTSAPSATLQAWAKDDIRVSRQLDTPLVALGQIINSMLSEPTTLCEFARQVAIAHSQFTGDEIIFPKEIHPHRQLLNQPPLEAAYTYTAIRSELSMLLEQLQNHQAAQSQPGSR